MDIVVSLLTLPRDVVLIRNLLDRIAELAVASGMSDEERFAARACWAFFCSEASHFCQKTFDEAQMHSIPIVAYYCLLHVLSRERRDEEVEECIEEKYLELTENNPLFDMTNFSENMINWS